MLTARALKTALYFLRILNSHGKTEALFRCNTACPKKPQKLLKMIYR